MTEQQRKSMQEEKYLKMIRDSEDFYDTIDSELKTRKEQKYKQFIAYDVGIYLYGKRHNLLKNYNDTDIFVNASTPFDEQYDIDDMLNEFPDTKFFHRKNLYT